jgi:PilZ domain-containing protein
MGGSKPGFVERRRGARMVLRVPVRVQGHRADGSPWDEMAMTEDADSGGAALVVRHTLSRGHVLHLSLPLPKRYRSYDLAAASYNVYAVVRNATALPDGTYRVGVMFLGRHPPRGHSQNPGGLYLLPADVVTSLPGARGHAGPERRARPRYEIAVQLTLTRPQPVSFGPPSERTSTRNLGVGGAMVLTALPLSRGDVVLVEDLQGLLRTRAEVVGLFIGKDNAPRLNLRFLDPESEGGVRALLRQHAIFE